MTAPDGGLEWSWENRPTPLRPIVARVAAVAASVGTLVTMAVGWGLLSVQTGSAVTGLLGLLPGLVTALTVIAAALGFVKRGEDVVTPLADPRTNAGDQLVARLGTAHIRTSTTTALTADLERRREQGPGRY